MLETVPIENEMLVGDEPMAGELGGLIEAAGMDGLAACDARFSPTPAA